MALRRNKKQEEPVRRGPARVLVVHDEPDGCELVVRLLDRAGHDTDRAHDFLEMSDKLLVPQPADCVVLEDAPAGVAAARAAGMRCIALATTHAVDALTDADAVVASLAALRVDVEQSARGVAFTLGAA